MGSIEFLRANSYYFHLGVFVLYYIYKIRFIVTGWKSRKVISHKIDIDVDEKFQKYMDGLKVPEIEPIHYLDLNTSTSMENIAQQQMIIESKKTEQMLFLM